MKAVLADTSYYVAPLNQGDVYHTLALRLSRELRCPVVTTEYVLLELGSALSQRKDRRLFTGLVAQLRADTETTIVRSSSELFESGLALFTRRKDKDWSLIDCISFVVMKQPGVAEALATDHHFGPAGFRVLLA
jgi:predicted nucleic acid-binding protein